MKKGFIVLSLIVILSIVPALVKDVARTNVNVSAKHMSLAEASDESIIMNNVYIGPVDVSGMTEDAAYQKVQGLVDDLSTKKLTVNIGEAKDTIPVEDLSFTWTNTDAAHEAASLGKSGNVIERFKAIHDIESSNYIIDLERSIDESMVKQFVEVEADANDKSAVNAYLKFGDDGKLEVVEGQNGLVVNQNASILNIVTYLTHTWNGGEPVCDMKVDSIACKGDLEELSQVQDVIGYYATDFSGSSENRYQNVANGAKKVSGYTLYPGDSFSVLDHLAPFTEENGYALAASYSNGQVEDSLGGGICQVSTTLYNAVIRAELQIDERSNHSMEVSYVDPSADAAIAEGSKDFIFTNNLEHPVYIYVETDSGVITAMIYGIETRDSNREISFVSEVLKTLDPEVKIVEDSSLSYGYVEQTTEGKQGCDAVLWKVVTVDGVETERVQFNSSEYEPQPITYTVGTNSSNSGAVGALENAIASNSIDKVYSVIESYS